MISVIITTKNRKSLLEKAIESVAKQSYHDFECVIIDDGSTDDTRTLVDRWVSYDGRFRYIYIDPADSRGGNHARNMGIASTAGELVAFLDDDDMWMEDKLRLQKGLMDGHPEVGMVYCQVLKDYVSKKGLKKSVPDVSYRGDCSKKIFWQIPCTTSVMMVRRNILMQAGLFDEKLNFWQEYDLCIRICQVAQIDFVRKYLAVIRCDTGDRARLTNKYQGWVEAVRYQNKKYRKELAALTPGNRRARLRLIYEDAKLRCQNAGDIRGQIFYSWKLYRLSEYKAHGRRG